MSKKYVIKRRNESRAFDLSEGGRLIEIMDPINDAGLVEFARSHPDVEDRTRPDYSDVPVGTAGTATIQGQLVRVIRAEENRWISATRIFGEHWHQERDVTDFVPDVVVDEALIEQVETIVRDACYTGRPDGAEWYVARAQRILRGDSTGSL